MPAAPRKQTGSPAESSGTKDKPSQLDQVRELLFGREAQAHREMLEQIRSAFFEALTQQEQQFNKRLAETVQVYETQLDALTRVIEQQQADQDEEIANMQGELDELAGLHDKHVTATDKSFEKLGNRQKNDASKFKKSVTELRQQLKAQIADSKGDLDTRKPDRAVLAKLFRSVADNIDAN